MVLFCARATLTLAKDLINNCLVTSFSHLNIRNRVTACVGQLFLVSPDRSIQSHAEGPIKRRRAVYTDFSRLQDEHSLAEND